MKKHILLIGLFLLIYSLSSYKEPKQIFVKNNTYREANLEIKETKYFIDNSFIQPVALETDKNKFLNGFKATSGNLNLVCNNNSNYIGTGCVLQTLLNQTPTSSNGIIVYGDVTGDGIGSITDLVQMVLHSTEKKLFSEQIKQLAADIDYDKKITTNDASSLANHIQSGSAIPHPSSKNIKTVIELSNTNINIEKNQNSKIIATTNKGDVTIINWKSANPGIALVDSTGLVTGISKGTTTITVTAKDGTTRDFKVTVNVTVPVTGISINKTNLSITEGEHEQLTAIISPSDATINDVLWTSSDTTIATVDNTGKIIAKKSGTTTIVAKTKDGNYTASCTVTVLQKNVNVTGVELDKTTGNIYMNSTNKKTTLKATISPTNATNKNITWASSNESVATVTNGTVTALSLGTTNITVTTLDGGYKATYKLDVKEKVIIVITASLGERMNDWFKKYTSPNNFTYSIEDKTLKYVYKSGSKFDYQIGEGLEIAKTFINDNYSSKKNYVEISMFFTMTGNEVKTYACSDHITTEEYNKIATNYNNAINSIKTNNYNIKGFILSHSPLNSSHSLAHKKDIVVSTNSNACSIETRSNWKYYLSNTQMKSVLNNYSNLTFIDYFSQYLRLDDDTTRKFTWLKDFSTPDDDALHWDQNTTISCMTTVFNLAGM